MIRKDVLEEVGWETSITEDFELTLKLYEKGYKVVYTPYIQAPAECVSTLQRLIRQRMRWAEGHSNNIKKMFTSIVFNKNLTNSEKLEFLYLSPYYLQAFFFLVGTISWLFAETLFPARLPFWTSLWGWSLVLTNLFSLPLMNSVGLFLEESEERDYTGILSFIALTYILVPFQAYASIKGFLEREEGPWFRTPKTGLITDVFTRGKFYRFITGILPGRGTPSVAQEIGSRVQGLGSNLLDPNGYTLNPLDRQVASSAYLALATANNQFNSFKVKPKRNRYIAKLALFFVVGLSSIFSYFGNRVPQGAITNLPIQARVEVQKEDYSAVSQAVEFLKPKEAFASSFTDNLLTNTTGNEVLGAIFILTTILSLASLLYLVRRKRKLLRKIIRPLFVIALVLSWLLASWPPILKNPRFPPKAQNTQAAAAGSATIESVDATTTSSTYEDVGTALTSGNFTVGDEYLILARASIGTSGNDSGFGIRVEHGTTAFADSEMSRREWLNESHYHYQWMTVWTAVSGEGLNFEAKSNDADTIEIDHMVITVINLTDVGTQGVDWFFNENGTDTTLTGSYSTTNNAQITIQSGDHDANDKHLILSFAQLSTGATGDTVQSEIARTGEASENRPTIIDQGGESGAGGTFTHYMALAHDLGASDNTFASRSLVSSGSSDRLYSSVFALNLNKFTAQNHAYTEAEFGTATTTDWADNIQTLTHDLSGEAGTTTNIIISYFIYDGNHANAQLHNRTQLDNADVVSGGSDLDHRKLLQASTNETPMGFSVLESSVSAASHTIDIDGHIDNQSNTPTYEDRLIVAFTLESSNSAPAAPTLHNDPFDNEKMYDTTPDFEFTADDPDGTADIIYHVQIDDDQAFGSVIVECESDTSCATGAGSFTNTESGGDTSPFNEGERIRFTPTTTLTSGTTYWWRVRAEDESGSGGSGGYGAWITAISITPDSGSGTLSEWFQTTDEQFDTGTLASTETTGSDTVGLGAGTTDVKVATGTFTTPSATGVDSIDSVGFQPKGIILWGVPVTSESSAVNAATWIGFADDAATTNEKVVAVRGVDASTNTHRTINESAVVEVLEGTSDTPLIVATLDSFDSAGFNLNYSTTSVGYYIHYVAFGGDDLEAQVGQEAANTSPVSGLDFQPELVFTSSAGLGCAGADSNHSIHAAFGAFNATDEWWLASFQGADAVDQDDKDAVLATTGFIGQYYQGSFTWEIGLTAFTSDGWTYGGTTNADCFYFLALEGSGVGNDIGTFTAETSGTEPTNQDLPDLGFTPVAYGLGSASTTNTGPATLRSSSKFTIGAYDGTNQNQISRTDVGTTPVADQIQNNDNVLGISADVSSAYDALATAQAITDSTPTITWNPNDTTAYVIGYWAIEDAGGAASGTIMSTEIDYDWFTGASAWDEVDWSEDETNGTIMVQVFYSNCATIIPNGDLSGNGTGFTSGPIDISGLSTVTYNEICIRATLADSGGTPYLEDWVVTVPENLILLLGLSPIIPMFLNRRGKRKS